MGGQDFLEVIEDGEKLEASMRARAPKMARFEESYDKFLNMITAPHSNHRTFQMKEAETTSDFPILFGTVLERTLKAKYSVMTLDYRSYVKTGVQNDFRSNNIIGIFGLRGAPAQVVERGEYKGDKYSEGKVANALKKYGKRFDISWEAIINDDLGAFSDVAGDLAIGAQRLEYREAVKLFVASTGPITTLFGAPISHPFDGTSITNKGTLSFTADNLGATIQLMRNQLDFDGEPMMFDGFELVVPPTLELKALEALSPAALIATGLSSTSLAARQTTANVVAQLGISLHVNPYLPVIDTSGNKNFTWYLFARLSNGAAIQMNFLRGHETPEIVQKAPNKANTSPMEGDFESDTIAWRVRHVLGGTQLDPRLAYAQVASS